MSGENYRLHCSPSTMIKNIDLWKKDYIYNPKEMNSDIFLFINNLIGFMTGLM